MRAIERPGSFKRDYKREAKGQYRSTLDSVLVPVIKSLVTDQAIEPRLRDHELTGEWVNYRECHLKPDLLLIYRKVGDDTLVLARLGSHSELFG